VLVSSLASALSALLTPAATDAMGFPINARKRVHRQAAPVAVADTRPARFVRAEREPSGFGGSQRDRRRSRELQTRVLGERESGRVYAFGG